MAEIANMYKEVKEIHDHMKRVKEVYGKELIKDQKPSFKSYCKDGNRSLPIYK